MAGRVARGAVQGVWILMALAGVGCPAPETADDAAAHPTLADLRVTAERAGGTGVSDGVASSWIEARSRAIAACLADAIDRDPALRGDILLTVSIAGDATLASPIRRGGTLGDLPAAKCAARAVESAPLPKPEGGGATIGLRLVLAGTAPAPPPPPRAGHHEHIAVVPIGRGDAADEDLLKLLEQALPDARRCTARTRGSTTGFVVWVVGRVDRPGAMTLETAPAGTLDEEAAHCVRRRLQVLAPKARNVAAAFSFVVGPEGGAVAGAPTRPERGSPLQKLRETDADYLSALSIRRLLEDEGMDVRLVPALHSGEAPFVVFVGGTSGFATVIDRVEAAALTVVGPHVCSVRASSGHFAIRVRAQDEARCAAMLEALFEKS